MVYICGASTTDERLRCLRAKLLQVQRYAFLLELQSNQGETDRLCDIESRMLVVLAPLLTLGELTELVLLSSCYAIEDERVFRNSWRVWSLWITECPLPYKSLVRGHFYIWRESRQGLAPTPPVICTGRWLSEIFLQPILDGHG